MPLTVVVDGQSFAEGVEITPGQVADALRRRETVSTSRISPGALLGSYQVLAESGASEIVSIHLSGDLSGTYDAAVLASRDAPVPVHVVDTRTIGLAMGFAVLRATAMAAAGEPGADIARATQEAGTRSRTWLVVDSLEQLRRGGRIGAAQALVGSALMVKPILVVEDGHVAPLEKQRTMRKAVERMAEIAIREIGDRPVDIAVQHVDAEQRAGELAQRLAGALPWCEPIVAEVGAVIAAHVGLGTVSIAMVPR